MSEETITLVNLRCDRCGRIEQFRSFDSEPTSKWFVLYVYRRPMDDDSRYKDRVDVCPSCKKALKAWWGRGVAEQKDPTHD